MKTIEISEWAEALNEVIERRGLSFEQAGGQMEVTGRTVYNWVREGRKPLRAHRKLAEAWMRKPDEDCLMP